MSAKKKWLDPDYIQTLKAIAEMYANSNNINPEFKGDSATIFSLLMKADAWNVQPELVIQGSFYDQYGQLAYTGKLIKLVLNNHPEISRVDVVEVGDWDKIHKKYRVKSQTNDVITYEETWDSALAPELGLSVVVQFYDSNAAEIKYTLHLADIDSSVKNLNPNWITAPRSQLESAMLRDLAHTRMYQYIHSMNPSEAYAEKHEMGVSTTTHPTQPMNITSESLMKMPLNIVDMAKHKQEQMLKELASSNYEKIDNLMHDLIELVKNEAAQLNDNDRYNLKAIYEECSHIVAAIASNETRPVANDLR
ncbi:hypothetical protein AAIA71_28565 (plasmid) [Vibrio harveyi]|uniref:hypothetical protein n=1 Tax=Vibrio harveyi TaxID=669 RepID=UPI002480B82C|nr:hypothetical protein [Vibrio harveyi]